MARSYYQVPEGQTTILITSKEVIQADAFIVHDADAQDMFKNFDLYQVFFEMLEATNKRFYIRLNTLDLKKTYQHLKEIQGKYISGWVVPHANQKLLNRLSVKAREIEQVQKLNYGSLHFIALIDQPEAVVLADKIAKYGRVKAIAFDAEQYQSQMGYPKTYRGIYPQEQVHLFAGLEKKQWIEVAPHRVMDDSDLASCKRFGSTSMITSMVENLSIIHSNFTPSNQEVLEAEAIISAYRQTQKKKRRFLSIDGKIVTEHQFLKSNEILENAQFANPKRHFGILKLTIRRNRIKEVALQEPIHKFYTFGEELGNAITHGIGIVFALVYLVMLWIKGTNQEDGLATFAYLMYAFSAIILYSMSTLYHSMPLGSRVKMLFKRFDHMTIYLLIAGTYTPFTLIALGGTLGVRLCIFLWVAAIIGLLLNLFWFGKFRLLHMFLYVSLGWVAIFFVQEVIAALGTGGLILLFAGGVSYTLGIVFYALKLFKFNHMIWHFFVLAGTILHFLSIYFYL